MRFYLDTEFHEYKKRPNLLGVPVGEAIDTIELISIGVVSEDVFSHNYNSPGNFGGTVKKYKSKEYYAICKEFDLKAAWGNEWLRENVLKPIHDELYELATKDEFPTHKGALDFLHYTNREFKEFEKLINKYGKTRKQIASEIIKFTYGLSESDIYDDSVGVINNNVSDGEPIEFYAYNADYDWVVFCWLFGRMIDLPKGFPMYCFDLKQELDSKVRELIIDDGWFENDDLDGKLKDLKQSKNYPKQTNEHNALDDAKWNKELHNFIENL